MRAFLEHQCDGKWQAIFSVCVYLQACPVSAMTILGGRVCVGLYGEAFSGFSDGVDELTRRLL